jgi:RNA polymerase sigma factor (sigma-70 family)
MAVSLHIGVEEVQTMAFPAYTPKISGTEEADLICKILGGRRDLFADLIAPHLTPLIRIIQGTIGRRPDVDDVVQQTALKAFTHLEQFRSEASFRTWLIRIGINEARDWRRKCASSRLLALDLLALTQLPAVDASPSPLAECQRRESSVRLRAALALLPEKYRIVVHLRDFEDLNFAEVARRLGLTLPAVKTRHLRARQKMAKFLERPRQLQPLNLAHQ